MSLVNGIDMLRQARAERYAVGGFDLINLEFAAAILAGAAAQRAPVILSLAQIHFDYMDMELIAPSLLAAAQRAPVPVAVHLDHGEDLETVVRAIRCGFTSVMIDGSMLPYEENVRLTSEVVRLAHACGVAVEAELGCVAGREFYSGGRDAAETDIDQVELIYTDPDQAADFVRRTGVDSLAVSVGTVHGLHRGRPRLDIPRLQRIHAAVPVPLVLHGGSGLSDEEFALLIGAGISKINFYSELSHAGSAAVRSVLQEDPHVAGITRLLGGIKGAVQAVVEEKIRLWGGRGRAAEDAAGQDVCGSGCQ